MADNSINTNHYELIFDSENLNLNNFKLKMASFTSYDHNIKKVYFNYADKLENFFKNKEYFSFDNTSLNNGIEKLKNEYNKVLKDNYLYDELESSINDTVIKKVEIYCEKAAITRFKAKYPNVKINIIND